MNGQRITTNSMKVYSIFKTIFGAAKRKMSFVFSYVDTPNFENKDTF